MTDKVTKFERMASAKPVPMKLFAAWEVDRTPSNCIPRLCSLTITRLSLLTPLPPDLTSLSLAVKMQSSKRTLRSHEIPVPQSLSVGFGSTLSGGNLASGGPGVIGQSGQLNSPPLLETELDLHFSLQYPHFIKRDGNRLLILLQRRKKYKTRTILGYKTLAEGVIRMDAVLQKSMDMTVELNGSSKAGRQGLTIATLRATQVTSIPVDQDNKNNNSLLVTDRVNEYSDEDEEQEFSSGDDNDDGLSGYAAKRNYAAKRDPYKKFDRGDNDEGGDEGNLLPSNQVDSDSDFDNLGKDKGSRAKMSRQRNFKQRIISLLKRFKVPDELEGDAQERGPSLRGKRDLDALFQELESLSCGEGDDSGQDMDSLSIGSTPKPSLRPFFENTKPTLTHQQSAVQLSSLQKSTKDFMPEKKTILEKRDSLAEKKSNSVTIANNIINSTINNNISNNNHTSNYNNSMSNNQDRSGDWKNDSSGNEGGAGNTDPEALSSDPQNAGSPPKEKETAAVEKKNRLFRTSSSTPNSAKKQKQSLTFPTTADQPKASPLETCLSPTNVEPRKSLLEQLSRTFTTEESQLPDVVTIVGPPETSSSPSCTPRLVSLISSTFRPTFSPNNTAEVKAITQALMNKIQKYCNSTAKPPNTVKVLLVGGDWLQGAVLRHYVELLGIRPPDWVNHIRFYIVPLGLCGVARYLSVIDSSYSNMFGTENWQQNCERAANLESAQSKNESAEIISRIQRYLHSAGPCTQVPIAEAMVNYRDEDSCQIFVPFISDVRIGCLEGPQLSLDLDETMTLNSQQSSDRILSSSPPQSGRASPPAPLTPVALVAHQSNSGTQESLELQIDYWPLARPILDGKDKSQSKGQDPTGKNSIKSTFRHLQVWRLPLAPNNGEYSNGLTLSYATKEKKQKSVMRLGKKKEKDRDAEKEQCVEGVARLICSPRQSHPVPMRVYIDGTEWTGVKFFQLSSQWQTHIKNFPIALVGAPLASAEMLT
ncbi:phosphofurin acidic cluster sorting protein 2 isoform X1 [Topomyia yanbarensis]|uniref:phosphofurin acidic cluster sorting protein 2 isoform X1 n=1 Tax=Topomyia yanbarensis TaxID=2498891 RepID=UPI00273B8A52|nr:phosphofurin acidic cluster sorting protein 2 isoform X1 [Topomyia yanbarensis]XP_058813905.1 phosphofurin acidic cluster sorting protein 2 isoform X1 [Topomyia yanbarensis]